MRVCQTIGVEGLAVLLLAVSMACGPVVETVQERGNNHYFRPTKAPVISSPVAFDADGDGKSEIAVGSWDGYFYLLDSNLRSCTGWPKFSRKGFFSSPALADLDEDGDLEIIVGSETGRLFAWHADGRAVSSFPVNLGYRIWATPVLLPGNRMAVGVLRKFFVLTRTGGVAPGWPQAIHGWPDATVASSGGNLVVTTLTPGDPSKGWIYWWGLDGSRMPAYPLSLEKDSDSSPGLVELDGDGRLWAVFGDDAGYLQALNDEGRQHEGFPFRTHGGRPDLAPLPHSQLGGNIHSIEASPAIADLDDDGFPDIAVGAWDGRMYVVNRFGALLPGWPVSVGDQIISSAAIADISGDGLLNVIVGSKDGNLYVWNVDGSSVSGFPRNLGAPVFSSPWVGDLDGDGRADIVVGGNNGIHLLKNVGPLGKVVWPMFHRNHERSGAFP